jgi:hypothetical protein
VSGLGRATHVLPQLLVDLVTVAVDRLNAFIAVETPEGVLGAGVAAGEFGNQLFRSLGEGLYLRAAGRESSLHRGAEAGENVGPLALNLLDAFFANGLAALAGLALAVDLVIDALEVQAQAAGEREARIVEDATDLPFAKGTETFYKIWGYVLPSKPQRIPLREGD